MDSAALQENMLTDLLVSEMEAKSAQYRVTSRAEMYMATGLPLDRVLGALKISRATWYRRVEALREWEQTNHAASVPPAAGRAEQIWPMAALTGAEQIRRMAALTGRAQPSPEQEPFAGATAGADQVRRMAAMFNQGPQRRHS
ncbi:MAG: hypothetical protein WAM97_15160 [Acidimicrobiales bacterium]